LRTPSETSSPSDPSVSSPIGTPTGSPIPSASAEPTPSAEPSLTAAPSLTAGPGQQVWVLVGAGDISHCENDNDEDTARLVEGIEGTVFTTGDNVYEDATDRTFRECYHPTWGRFRDRTRPVPGNHDYHVEDGAAYYRYFGEAAGRPGEGWYTYDLGPWRIYALNTNCSAIGGCGPDSPQTTWLREDLEARPNRCTIAIFHHPRWATGHHGDSDFVDDIWEALDDAGVELVLNGHEHHYERYAPRRPDGTVDHERGIRQIIVGTGGRSRNGFESEDQASEIRSDDAYGVLKLSLRDDEYRWRFIPVPRHDFTDSGSDRCH
jgi:acid phosphatase type 7